MAVITNTTTTTQMSTMAVREVDFIERFQTSWAALRDVLGISRPIRKDPGTKLSAGIASITLQSGTVAEGDEVPLSQATVVPAAIADITLQKYRKAVTAEAVAKYGAAIASQKTDDAMLAEVTGNVLSAFYTFAQTGSLTGTYTTFQMAVSMAIGKVKNEFQTLHKDYTNVVVFVNTLDLYEYLGAAPISVQNTEGVQYLKNFLGAETMILTSEIPQGTVVATPAENIVLYYIDPADADLRELGLEYRTSADETGVALIGVHKEGNYGRVIGETHVLVGMSLFAEILNGIAVVSISSNP